MALICLDTTAISDLVRGQDRIKDRMAALESEGARFCTTSVNAYEALVGIELHRSDRERATYAERFDRMLAGMVVIPFGLERARAASSKMAALYGRGRPASTMDLLTASTARAAGCEAVLTRNGSQFRRIGLLTVIGY